MVCRQGVVVELRGPFTQGQGHKMQERYNIRQSPRSVRRQSPYHIHAQPSQGPTQNASTEGGMPGALLRAITCCSSCPVCRSERRAQVPDLDELVGASADQKPCGIATASRATSVELARQC
jgi:hypothetical protein